MTRAERIRSFPKTGWRNQLARRLNALKKHPAASNFLSYQPRTRLQLPFSGEWHVYWGGRTIAQNYHAAARDQRFAYDFLILRAGKSFRDAGEKNDDYFCFGQPVFAPADGLVFSRGDDVPDNPPGEMNAEHPLGNYVILDHGDGEFSVLAHLRHGTVRVQGGERIRAGHLLGECGNSGRSSEAHLHYHLQNTGIPFRGEGLPVFFVEYLADAEPVTRGEPVARQTVRSQRELGGQ